MLATSWSIFLHWMKNKRRHNRWGWDGFEKNISVRLVFIHQQESSEKERRKTLLHTEGALTCHSWWEREREKTKKTEKSPIILLNECCNGRSRNQIRRQKIHGTWKRLKWFDGQLFPCVVIGGFIAEVYRVFPIRLVERIDGRGFFETGIHFPMIN